MAGIVYAINELSGSINNWKFRNNTQVANRPSIT